MKKVLYKQTLTLIMENIFIHKIIKASIYGVLNIILNALYILTHLMFAITLCGSCCCYSSHFYKRGNWGTKGLTHLKWDINCSWTFLSLQTFQQLNSMVRKINVQKSHWGVDWPCQWQQARTYSNQKPYNGFQGGLSK